jgi:WD40 repeat protein
LFNLRKKYIKKLENQLHILFLSSLLILPLILSNVSFFTLDESSFDHNEEIFSKTNVGPEVIYHLDPINTSFNTVVFSPNGYIIASGGLDTNVYVWSLVNHDLIFNFTDHTGAINDLVFSYDGNLLISASEDTTVKVWDLIKGELVYNFDLHSSPVISLAASPTSPWIASGSRNPESIVRIWDISTGQLIQNITGHMSDVTALAFSLDSFFATGSKDNTINLYRVDSWFQMWTFVHHEDTVTSLCFSPDETILASGSIDNTINLWNIFGLNLKTNLFTHSSGILDIEYSPKGDSIAFVGVDQTVYRLSISSASLFQSLSFDYFITALDHSPDGNLMLISGGFSPIHIWNIADWYLDNDQDGMLNYWEFGLGFNPFNFSDRYDDVDNDGLINILEYYALTDPLNKDTDKDSMSDGWEFFNGLNPVYYDMSYFDMEADGMPNVWEFQMGLIPNFDDSLRDLDEDGMPNRWEYEMGLNAAFNDSSFDLDLDGLPNYWEYQMGLNANNQKDSLWDKDNDGMSNYWEYLMSFDPLDPTDANFDIDNDGISNLDEYKANTNPRDFWSVPLFSASYLHFLIGLLIIIGFGTLGYVNYHYNKNKNLIKRLGAPNYSIAQLMMGGNFESYDMFLKAKKLGATTMDQYQLVNLLKAPNYIMVRKILKGNFEDYTQYEVELKKTKELLELALKQFSIGEYEIALQHLESCLPLFEKLGDMKSITEVLFNILHIKSELGQLEGYLELKNRLPSEYYEDESTQVFKLMFKALSSQIEDNWGVALELWEKILDILVKEQVSLGISYQIFIYEALTLCSIKKWQLQSNIMNLRFIYGRFDQWEDICKKNGKYEGLCKIFLLKAKLAVANFEFPEAESYINQVITTADEMSFSHIKNLAEKEKADLKEMISKIYDDKSTPKAGMDQIIEFGIYLKELSKIFPQKRT